MDMDWAAKNLEVIRTLMERSSLYRRALAPIMTLAGIMGLSASFLAVTTTLTNFPFSIYWLATALITAVGGTLLVRRQAMQDKEDFWSPPTRRVFQSLLPSFAVGLFLGALFAIYDVASGLASLLAIAWLVLYACGLHSAGTYMTRGIRLWAWILILVAILELVLLLARPELQTVRSAHIIMGATFGFMHLCYGAYLYLTERRNKEA